MQLPNVNLYIRWLFLVVLLTFAEANATDSKVFEGDSLPEPLNIELNFEGAHYALVIASQKSADYVLSLKEKKSKEILRTVSISADTFMDEVLFFAADSCINCMVALSGKEAVDRNSPYNLDIQYFTKSEIADESNASLKAMLEAITAAGEYGARTVNAGLQESKAYRSSAVQRLTVVLDKKLSGEHAIWNIHAKSLLLQILGELRQREGAKELAAGIVRDSGKESTEYVIRALYTLAALSTDILQKGELFKQAMTHAKETDKRTLYAYGANRLGVSLVKQAQFDQAMAFLDEAREVWAYKNNFRALIETLHNMSWANLRSGNLPKAIADAAEQKLFAEQYESRVRVIWALYDLALAYGELGERYEADSFLDRALTSYKELNDELKLETQFLYGALLQERAESLLGLGDYDSARDHALQMGAYFSSKGHDAGVARARYVEGRIALANDETEVARELIFESIEFEQNNNRYRNAGLRYLRLAELETKEGNLVQAAGHQVAALNLISETQDRLTQAAAFSQSVELLTRMGDLDEAKRVATRAANFIKEYGREQNHAKFAYRLAHVEFQLGKHNSALTYLAQARSVIDETLPKVKRRDLRRRYFALQKSVFELNIKVLNTLDKSEEALLLVESYKARTLRDVISQVIGSDDLSQELIGARDKIHAEILGSARDWYASDKIDTRELLTKTRQLSSNLEKIEVELETSQFNSRVDNYEPAELPKVTHLDEVMAYYFIGGVDSWLWLISSDGCDVFRLPPESELIELVGQVKKQFSTHPSNRIEFSAWEQKKQLKKLSEILLAPMRTRLMSGSIVNLTVIPDGILNGLPFSPLLLEGIEGPLVKQVAISYIPSNESRKALDSRAEAKQSHAPVRVLVVADPVDRVSNVEEIARLPYSANEAKFIKTKFAERAKLMLAESASKEDVLSVISEGYSILHFATHGLLNNSEPTLSGLMFSKLSQKPNLWLAPEISRANLNANLVVLSACESSIGKGIPGEGMFSLSRAFIEGGASHVIGSLWKVEDASTADVMGNFYSALLDDSLVVSVALQRAQIATYSNKNNDWRDPYFWAGFQLQGGWNTLSYGRKQGT